MTIKDLSDLKKLIKLCRTTGIESIKVDGIEMHLGAAPRRAIKAKPEVLQDPLANASIPKFNGYTEVKVEEKILTEELSDEQLMFYSARPEAFEGQQ